jgi:ribosomal protein S27E
MSLEKIQDMTQEEFNHKFPDEASCRAHWKAQREKLGITCYKCRKTEMYWNKANEQWRCKTCKAPISLRKGTFMENTHLPFQMWYKALFLISSSQQEITAHKMQAELGHKFYEPVWYMMQKIRTSIGQEYGPYEISQFLESENASFLGIIPQSDITKKNGDKRIG